MSYRRAGAGDVPALAALYRDAAMTLGPQVYTPEQVHAWARSIDDTERFRRYVLDAVTWIDVADDGAPRAFCGIAVRGGVGEVHSLYVSAALTRQGIGRALLAHAMREARAAGAREFEAWATPFSRPVFERAGFALAGVVSEPYQGVEFERYRMATAPAGDVPARLSHKAEGRAAPGRGEGLFAREAIACGEPIVEWTGRALSLAQWQRVPQRIRENSVQIGDDAYLVPDVLVAGDHVNHSCEPNAGLRGDRTIVAMRDIAAGEEITYDYAMSDGSPYDEFVCCCGAPACRGNVTGDDWRRPELQERYRGWFSPYLAARIRRGG